MKQWDLKTNGQVVIIIYIEVVTVAGFTVHTNHAIEPILDILYGKKCCLGLWYSFMKMY